MNQDVSDVTEKLIEEMIPAGILGTDTASMIVNAIYFAGKWDEPFKKDLTKEENFYVSKNVTRRV